MGLKNIRFSSPYGFCSGVAMTPHGAPFARFGAFGAPRVPFTLERRSRRPLASSMRSPPPKAGELAPLRIAPSAESLSGNTGGFPVSGPEVRRCAGADPVIFLKSKQPGLNGSPNTADTQPNERCCSVHARRATRRSLQRRHPNTADRPRLAFAATSEPEPPTVEPR